MRRILGILIILVLSASFAHATNRFTPPGNATRRVPPITTKLWSHKPNINQSLKSQGAEVEVFNVQTRRPLIPLSLTGHKVSVEKIKSQQPLIYPVKPGSQFPTPKEAE